MEKVLNATRVNSTPKKWIILEKLSNQFANARGQLGSFEFVDGLSRYFLA